MQIETLTLPGISLIKPQRFSDQRGFFSEIFHKQRYIEKGINCEFVQDNHSFSQRGTLRGMHFQRTPGQAKLIWVVQGVIFDVVVDICPTRSTFGKWLGVYLDAEKGDQLFIPTGYAHGFCVISETAHVCYKVDNFFDPLEEKGFRYDDPDVGIKWPLSSFILSEKDRNHPFLRQII
ncbi:MAG TPA: dTDP-4-dehydrorhamnose 3,5-epimerase [Candidatus Rhabdochlamydia sp.]|jgi:dTDP-4-dehydrorhamnose 3,5-epimerase|nr:dTDP-4-dehydrorhamnose 3,5-epimerase [Candidatus Rhabdochlamydia sp.]